MPGTLNSKHHDVEVKAVQEWDGRRVRPNKQFMITFHEELVKQKLRELRKLKSLSTMSREDVGPKEIAWVERLLQTPVADGRKTLINLTLSVYLIKIKGVTPQEAVSGLLMWLTKCDQLRRFDGNKSRFVKEAVKRACTTTYSVMGESTIKHKRPDICHLLVSAGIFVKSSEATCSMLSVSIRGNGYDIHPYSTLCRSEAPNAL